MHTLQFEVSIFSIEFIENWVSSYFSKSQIKFRRLSLSALFIYQTLLRKHRILELTVWLILSGFDCLLSLKLFV